MLQILIFHYVNMAGAISSQDHLVFSLMHARHLSQSQFSVAVNYDYRILLQLAATNRLDQLSMLSE